MPWGQTLASLPLLGRVGERKRESLGRVHTVPPPSALILIPGTWEGHSLVRG